MRDSTRQDQPTIDFVAKVIVNRVAEDILSELKEDRKKFVDQGYYKKWHTDAAKTIGGYFIKK